MTERVSELGSSYWVGYMQGVADTGARLIGAAAVELGQEHPLIDRMVQRLGQVAGEATGAAHKGEEE